MKIAFFSPADYKNNLQKQFSGPTLGLAYIAANIKKNFGFNDLSIEVDVEHLLAKKPDLIGISSYTEEFDRTLLAAAKIKSRTNVPILLGGAHITALPDTLPDSIDVGVIGDGEETIIDLLRIYQKDLTFSPDKLQQIKGIIFHDQQGNKINTGKRDVPLNLDDLPPPDREIFQAWHPELRRSLKWQHRLYTSRGCPFSCIFCMYSKMTKRNMRYHSVERVIGDIYDIRRTAPEQEHIFIADDLFVIDKKRLSEIAVAIRSEGFHKQVSFMCLVRANVFDDEIAAILKSMNTSMVSFGFESGSDQILRYLKGGISVKHNQRAADSCQKYGIKTGAYFVTGAPVETYADLAKTYWFIRHNQNHLKQVETFSLIPLPETVVWDYAVREGFIDLNNINWKNISYLSLQGDNYLFMNKEYSLAEFKYAHENFFSKYNVWSAVVYQREQLIKTFREAKTRVIEAVLHNTQKQKILEISTVAETLNLDQENITFVSPAEIDKVSGDYDLIFVNNVFSVFTNPECLIGCITNLISESGELKIFVHNLANIDVLNKLLAGSFDSNFLSYCDFSLRKIERLEQVKKLLLENNLLIEKIEPFKVLENDFQEIKNLIEAINNYLPISSFTELNCFGWLLTCKLSKKVE